MNLLLGIIIATIISFLNFTIVDTYFGLPEKPGVLGAKTVGQDIKKRGGDLAGGYFQGNILCSPDASAGTLLSSIAVTFLGYQGGLIAALLILIGNRLCADPGYAGTTGTLTMTALIFILSFIGIDPTMCICGTVISITIIQGIYHKYSSKLLGNLAKKMNRYTKDGE